MEDLVSVILFTVVHCIYNFCNCVKNKTSEAYVLFFGGGSVFFFF